MFKTNKLISVSGKNYTRLKRLGFTGDSFNDVISQILDAREKIDKIKAGLLHVESGFEPQFTSAATANSTLVS